MSLLKISLMRLLAVAVMMLAPPGVAPAAAAAMNITLTGTFAGSLDGQSFEGRAVTFTGLTDSDDTEEVFDEFHHPLSLLTVSFGSESYDVTEPVIFFVAPLSGLAGIVDPDASKGLVRFDYTAGNSFHTDALTQAFSTSGGALLLRSGAGIALTGVSLPETADAVPEPGTWAMLLLGFAITGTALRRRQSRSTPAGKLTFHAKPQSMREA